MDFPFPNVHRSGSILRAGVFFALGVAALLGLAVSFWAWPGVKKDSDFQRRGVLRVGYAVEEPYAFVTEEGQVSGAFPTMAEQIARELGIRRVEWRLASFKMLIDGLSNHQFDVIAAGMFVTPERQRRVAFSLPAFKARPGLLVERGNPHGLHSYAALKADASIRVAVLRGAVEEADLARLGVEPGRLIRTSDARMGRLLVASNQVDALALSLPTLEWMVRQGKVQNAEIAVPFETGAPEPNFEARYSAFAFRKDDEALRKAWNRVMRKYIGSGKHLEAVEPFGFSAADLPSAAAVYGEPPAH